MHSINYIYRSLLAVLLVSLIMFQTSRTTIVMAWYQMCQESITEQYCVNIGSPEMMCNAKCHIQKILQTDSSHDDFPQFVSNYNLDIICFIEEPVFLLDFEFEYVVSPVSFYYKSFCSQEIDEFIDHPPQV